MGEKHTGCEFVGDHVTLGTGAKVARHLRIGAASWKLGATAPTAGFSGIFPHLSFADGADEEAHYQVIVPYRWDTATDIEVIVDWYYTGAQDNGKVLWNMDYLGRKAGESPVAAPVTISKLTAGNHTTGQMVRSVFTAKMLAANLEVHDILGLKIWRNGDDGSDTLAKAAILLGVHIQLTQNKLGKAV